MISHLNKSMLGWVDLHFKLTEQGVDYLELHHTAEAVTAVEAMCSRRPLHG